MEIKKIIIPTPEEPVCDFCSSPDVVWRYPAKNDEVSAVVVTEDGLMALGSLGDWAVCAVCAALIEDGNRLGLLARTLGTIPDLDGMRMPPEVVRQVTKRIHDGFWAKRCGERRKAKEGT